jgi:hypothetical protein
MSKKKPNLMALLKDRFVIPVMGIYAKAPMTDYNRGAISALTDVLRNISFLENLYGIDASTDCKSPKHSLSVDRTSGEQPK